MTWNEFRQALVEWRSAPQMTAKMKTHLLGLIPDLSRYVDDPEIGAGDDAEQVKQEIAETLEIIAGIPEIPRERADLITGL